MMLRYSLVALALIVAAPVFGQERTISERLKALEATVEKMQADNAAYQASNAGKLDAMLAAVKQFTSVPSSPISSSSIVTPQACANGSCAVPGVVTYDGGATIGSGSCGAGTARRGLFWRFRR